MRQILLVEDDEFISDLIEAKLHQAGFTVTKTGDGNSVLRELEANRPDLVLLDLMLPNKHGFVVLEEMRNVPEFQDLPVIILSNENGPDVEEKAKLFNAKYFFKAMTDMSELVPIINETLQ